jgi:hypothetical protein
MQVSWLDFFRKEKESTVATVSFDDEIVTCRRSRGVEECVRWSDLRQVSIETTDAGPAADDVFWVLQDGGAACVIPSESVGMPLLLERLQQLPNFDNEAVIRAMGCTENQQFVCWRRSESGNH